MEVYRGLNSSPGHRYRFSGYLISSLSRLERRTDTISDLTPFGRSERRARAGEGIQGMYMMDDEGGYM